MAARLLRFLVPLVIGAIAPVISISLSSSCSLNGIANGGSGGMSSSSTGVGGHGAANVGGMLTTTTSSSSSGGSGGAPPTCPDDMKEVRSNGKRFCVDMLEVTNSQYLHHLANSGAPKSDPDGLCAWNTTYEPAVPPDASDGDLPVLGVDWCDAYAYCKAQEKRLCGDIDGGALAMGHAGLAGDQWFVACSDNDRRAYPYGTQDASYAYCSDCDPDAGCDLAATRSPDAASPVGSHPLCQGGFAGLFDMSGNAWEWQDSCDSEGVDEHHHRDPSEDHCYRRGGGYDVPHVVNEGGPGTLADKCLGCAPCSAGRSTRHSRGLSTGLRCCLDLAP